MQSKNLLSWGMAVDKIRNLIRTYSLLLKVVRVVGYSQMMIGIRNKKGKTLGPKSIEVWVNELRLTSFDEKGGWAGVGRISGNLADLGTYSVAGR